ncbi:putative acyl-ACP thioesterase superfamily [Treponema primitia ZAS-2]|uniref:Putative acyl-ACP thioesterase superfamily n=1 Tax=Treponema primitia (strain ATCC BAA-887 / DSM 12427 / ZAS-2) TaxID=545694 RepID=F5YIQ3_TREPZ|nr:acyl-ACP thioesterase domain-containing protein [Treponema primitia]AEF84590.1 putative acyl-ACP thioesterase superfamily [Treponema primitia ZAS-2]
MDVWKESYPVGFTAVDESEGLTLAAAFDYFQEAARRHAEVLGVGQEPMVQAGQGWVLSRISVLVERRPRQGELITVSTWPRGWEKLFALRDFDIRDESDKPIVRARSCWLIVNIEKRRPLRPQATMEKLPLNEGRDALPGGGVGLAPLENLLKAGDRVAAYSDIDYNGHVNNARYVQWVQDIADPTALVQAKTLRLDINYLSEVKIHEPIELWTEPLPAESDAVYTLGVEGRRNGGAVFRAELRIKD